MKRRTLILGIALSMATGLMFFENCSNAKFNSSGADLESMALNTPLQVGESQIKISAQQVPNLKLFFVVDNSYTMKANAVNLGKSFAQMFGDDQNTSLKRFDTTAFLISTAQKAEPLDSPLLKAVASPQLKPSDLANLTLPSLAQLRAGAIGTGAVPGDSVGFSALLSPDGLSASFLPAPVLGDDGTGQVGTGIHKAMGDSSDGLAAEFQRRMAMLNTDRQPAQSNGDYVFGDVLDNESGLCATARILRNSSGLVQPGEQAAFVIVSDEDENDPQGKSCVQSFNTTQPTDQLVNITCESRSSALTYTVAGKAADQCSAKFQTGYSVKYVYPVATVTTPITYRKVTPGTVNIKQSSITFNVNQTKYAQTSTAFTYFTKACTEIKHDNVGTGTFDCVFTGPISGSAKGSLTGSACVAPAQAASGNKAVTSDTQHPISCGAISKADVASCPANDPTCVGTTNKVAGTPQTVDGTFTADQCLAKAKTLASNVVDALCPPVASRSAASCPSGVAATDCSPGAAAQYSNPTVSVTGDFSADAACQTKAKTLAGAAVDDQNRASCGAPVNGSNNKTFTGNILFADSGDGGSVVGTGASCGAIRAAVVAAAKKADAAAPADQSTFACSITGYTTGTDKASAANGACDASSVAQICSASNNTKRTCTGQFSAGAPTSTPTAMPPVPFDIACDSLCKDSNNVLCSSTGGVTPTDTMTIAQYLVARYGAGTTCAFANDKQTVANFPNRPVADQAKLCKGSPSQPQYLVASAPFRAPAQVVTDWVAGSNADGSAPASSLGDFLTTHSKSFFTLTQPLVSVLVRTPADPLGDGGTRGTEYTRVATAMGGRADSVLSNDYASSLRSLSGIIQDRLQRSFVIADMKPAQSVKQVMLLKAGTSQWITLQETDWTAVGNNVIISKSVAYSPDDYLRVRYY